MKMAKKTMMKLTILAVALTMTAGSLAPKAAAQTDAIDNARSVAKSLQQKQANDSNAALDAAGVPAASQPAAAQPASAQPKSVQPASSTKPAPGAPAPAVKPAQIPGAKSAQAQAAPATATKSAPAVKAASGSSHNQLQKVNVVKSADSVQIEISSSEAVTPKVEKLKSPDRIAITFPETSVASAQNKIAVDAGGVRGVRIGMDGKTPPTTSVVVDLEKSLTYDLSDAAGKAILTLHTQGGMQAAAVAPAKTAAPKVVAKSSAPAPAPVTVKNVPVAQATATTKNAPVVAKAVPQAQPAVAKNTPPAAKMQLAVAKPQTTAVKADPMAPKAGAKLDPKTQVEVAVAAKTEPVVVAPAAPAKADEKKADKAEDKAEDKKWAMSGKRDPFFSPVVQQQGSGCSTGKKCLEIGNINVRGVVKSDNGFIAVVTNNLNKAYFLRENDPVFNGYVVKITGDSVTFQETVQDKLGKTSTREVTKRIVTPAV
jgi:hypothetical protein